MRLIAFSRLKIISSGCRAVKNRNGGTEYVVQALNAAEISSISFRGVGLAFSGPPRLRILKHFPGER